MEAFLCSPRVLSGFGGRAAVLEISDLLQSRIQRVFWDSTNLEENV